MYAKIYDCKCKVFLHVDYLEHWPLHINNESGGGGGKIYNLYQFASILIIYFLYFTILFPYSLKEFYGKIKAVHLVEAPL